MAHLEVTSNLSQLARLQLSGEPFISKKGYTFSGTTTVIKYQERLRSRLWITREGTTSALTEFRHEGQ